MLKKDSGKRLLRRTLLTVFSLIIVVLIVGKLVANAKAKQCLANYSLDLKLKNLKGEVDVFRDEVGIPHIVAKNQEDLYRSTGYLMAQERLWQMDLLRRVTLGRLSEIFGADQIETDLLLRSLQYSRKSKEILGNLPSEVLESLNAFCDGVNQFIDENKDGYPLEFALLGYSPEKWEPYHSLNLIGFMAWDLKAGWNELVLDELAVSLDSNLYAQLLPESIKYSTPVFPSGEMELLAQNKLLNLNKLAPLGVDILCGSNNWAVSGSKSTTGKPILANDMHLKFSVPGIWFQAHQKVPGELNVSGLLLPGQPFVVVGHNDSIAWGMTNTYVDNVDYYQEKINPENEDQYRFNDKWLDFETYVEKIKVKGDSVAERIYRRNHRGPVVSQIKGVKDKVLTIHWVGDEPSNEMFSIYKVNRAGNWDEFKEAFKTFKSISQNVAYADVKGNIGLYACAGVPIRKRDAIFRILPGWTDEYDWKGMVPFEELPHEYNPDRGYVSSANNRTIDTAYPYHIGTWYSEPYRISRIREMLEAKQELSVQDFKNMQNDYHSKYAELVVAKLFPLIKEGKLKGIEKEVYALLKEWDGEMDKDLVQPTILETFQFFLVEAIFKDEMGGALFEKFSKTYKLFRIALYNILGPEDMLWYDNVNTNKKESLADNVNLAFTKTVSYLENKYRSNINHWKWGQIHQITLAHPLSKVEILDKIFDLNRGPYRVSGSNHTVSPYSFVILEPGKVHHGASHRHIYSLANWDSVFSVMPTGNSGVVSSDYYCNQTERFIKGGYYQELYSTQQVKAKSKHHIVIRPK